MIRVTQTARSIPFKKVDGSLISSNLQEALEEVDIKINQEVINRQNENNAIFNSIEAYRDEFVVDANIITNGIELSVERVTDILPNSVFAFVDRLGLFENFDFQLSNGPNNKVVFTFSPSVIISQSNPTGVIDGGEFLRIHYLTKIR